MDTKRTRSAGGIVLGDNGAIALVRNKRGDGSWLFPKGHLEAEETDEAAARREIQEETGLTNLELIDDLGEYERFRIAQDGKDDPSELKVMKMFLFAAEPHATLTPSMEIEEARWVSFREVSAVLSNPKDITWFASVFERVREAIQRD
jgi:8-oxo-dGTP pyrophosphatase MutT (NUDIX family)